MISFHLLRGIRLLFWRSEFRLWFRHQLSGLRYVFSPLLGSDFHTKRELDWGLSTKLQLKQSPSL